MSLAIPMNSLSVIIITKNEAKKIVACLKSVQFADEIIVLDSGSTDDTISLALQYTPQVHCVDWPGFGAQKNRALNMCHNEWILSLDADEQVTPKLQHEIQQILQKNPPIAAFKIPRKSKYCDKWIKYGDWRNDDCLRLFRRDHARFKEVPVHEELIVKGEVQTLKQPLLHYSFDNLEEVLRKVNSYSSLSALHKHKGGKKSSLKKAIIHGLWTFFRGYILKLGFLDGKMGFLLAFSNAEGCYYRYVKMMLLNNNS